MRCHMVSWNITRKNQTIGEKIEILDSKSDKITNKGHLHKLPTKLSLLLSLHVFLIITPLIGTVNNKFGFTK